MTFDQLIPRPVCHPQAAVDADGPLLVCEACRTPYLNIVEYAQRDWEDWFYSCRLAEAFHAWGKGNDPLPVTFPLVGLDGIHDTKVRGQSLQRVRETVKLLRAVNAPFTTRPEDRADLSDPEMTQFFQRYMQVVAQYRSSPDSEAPCSGDQMLEEVMKGMYQMIQSNEFTHPFQFYFEKLVPFVLSCAGTSPPAALFAPVPTEDTAAKELWFLLQQSSHIRRQYGKYSIPFDIIHVMLGCYCCSSDVNAVGNWVLDLVARVCRGEYFWTRYRDNRFARAMVHFLHTDVSITRDPHLSNLIRQIQQGQAAEILSEHWQKYGELQKRVLERFRLPKVDPAIREMAIHQTFPAVLFERAADQLGFMLGLSHLLLKANLKRGLLHKGALKKAKEIHKLVMRFVTKVEAFDRQRIHWTLDTLQLFLVSDQQPEEEIRQLMQLVLTPEGEEEGPR